jgi:multicomponent Na+:H+ antiporter subunit C
MSDPFSGGPGLFNYLAAFALVLIGLHGAVARPNLIKKLMAVNVLQVGVIAFFISLGAKTGASAPILMPGAAAASAYANPLVQVLMLTAIVVSVSGTGVALALLVRIHRRYGTLEEPELLRGAQEDEET